MLHSLRLLAACGLAALVGVLGGCNTTAVTPTPVVTPPTPVFNPSANVSPTPTPLGGLSTLITNIQQRVVSACNFEVSLQTIDSLIETFAPSQIAAGAQVVDAAVTAICTAVRSHADVTTSVGAHRMRLKRRLSPDPYGSVNGIPVQGNFVN